MNFDNGVILRQICVEPFCSSLKLRFILINVAPTYGPDKIHTTSQMTGIVFLRMSSSIRLSTLELLTVYASVLEFSVHLKGQGLMNKCPLKGLNLRVNENLGNLTP